MSKRLGAETIELRYAGPLVGRFEERGPAPAPEVIEGCAIIPRTAENPERGTVVVTGLEVFAPAGTRLEAVDKVAAREDVWDVEGEPAVYIKRNGREKAVRIMLTRVGGDRG